MDPLDSGQLTEPLSDLVHLNGLGSGLHNYHDALVDDFLSGQHNNDREEEGAEGVNDFVFGLNIYDYTSKDDSDTLKEVSKNVDISSLCVLTPFFLYYHVSAVSAVSFSLLMSSII
jgi:hypothetical protein